MCFICLRSAWISWLSGLWCSTFSTEKLQSALWWTIYATSTLITVRLNGVSLISSLLFTSAVSVNLPKMTLTLRAWGWTAPTRQQANHANALTPCSPTHGAFRANSLKQICHLNAVMALASSQRD